MDPGERSYLVAVPVAPGRLGMACRGAGAAWNAESGVRNRDDRAHEIGGWNLEAEFAGSGALRGPNSLCPVPLREGGNSTNQEDRNELRPSAGSRRLDGRTPPVATQNSAKRARVTPSPPSASLAASTAAT